MAPSGRTRASHSTAAPSQRASEESVHDFTEQLASGFTVYPLDPNNRKRLKDGMRFVVETRELRRIFDPSLSAQQLGSS